MSAQVNFNKVACRITATVYGVYTWGKKAGEVNPASKASVTVFGEHLDNNGKEQNAFKKAIKKLDDMGVPYTIAEVKPVGAYPA